MQNSPEEDLWPSDKDGYIFLGRAIDLYGALQVNAAAIGPECEMRPRRRLPWPEYAESFAPRWRELRVQTHHTLRETLCGIYVSSPSPNRIGEDYAFTKSEWDAAGQIRCMSRQSLSAYINLRDAFAVGRIRTRADNCNIDALAWLSFNSLNMFNMMKLEYSPPQQDRCRWIFVHEADLKSERQPARQEPLHQARKKINSEAGKASAKRRQEAMEQWHEALQQSAQKVSAKSLDTLTQKAMEALPPNAPRPPSYDSAKKYLGELIKRGVLTMPSYRCRS